MTITVNQVRIWLKNLPDQFVSDETILAQIEIAEWTIGKEKSAAATITDVDNAVMIRTAYFTTLAYSEESERALGVISPSLTSILMELKTQYEKAIEYIRRGAPVFVTDFALSPSIWEEIWDP